MRGIFIAYFIGPVSTLRNHIYFLQVFQYHGKVRILICILKIVKLRLKEGKGLKIGRAHV